MAYYNSRGAYIKIGNDVAVVNWAISMICTIKVHVSIVLFIVSLSQRARIDDPGTVRSATIRAYLILVNEL